MTPFDYLIIAHLIGDFPLQTSWMAINKFNKWLPLLSHSALYTAIIELFSWIGFGGLAFWQLVVIFLVHILLDRRKFVNWWIKTIMRTNLSENQWLSIMVDQTFHLTVLALIVHFI